MSALDEKKSTMPEPAAKAEADVDTAFSLETSIDPVKEAKMMRKFDVSYIWAARSESALNDLSHSFTASALWVSFI